MDIKIIKSVLFGVAVGDALGVPVEFETREYLAKNPVTAMQEFGTHNQPKGTWSDDSSLTFCLAEVLSNWGMPHLLSIAGSFVNWRGGYVWTPYGKVFDIGITTNSSIYQLGKLVWLKDVEALKALKSTSDENSNGNGSLMRILPLLFYIKGKNIEEQFEVIWDVSALTHPHIRSAYACLFYLKFAEYLINGENCREAYKLTQKDIADFFESTDAKVEERLQFSILLDQDIALLSVNEIKSSGYVIDTLEAAVWCILNSKTYSEAVLKAVNLGDDTDTTAAVAGGLAGLLYGFESIPYEWVNQLARKDDIDVLAEKLAEKMAEKL
ncbi:MAG: ADP-ribosylglycohydrolase family protein [Paludibacter sp.]